MSKRRDRLADEMSSPPAGTLVRRRALGSEATYRIIGENDRGVVCEVLEAPGLRPGYRLTLTVSDVLAMDCVSSVVNQRPRAASGAVAPRGRFA